MDHSSDASAVITDLRHLRRSPDERVVAGVCGGVARRLRIDPVILRVLVVVLTFFGGVGAFLYALAWLFMPVDEPDGRSLVEDAASGGTGSLRSKITVVGLAIATVAIGVSSIIGEWGHTALLVLAVVGLVALLARERAPYVGPTATPPPPWHPPGPAAPPTGPWSTPPGTPYEMYEPRATATSSSSASAVTTAIPADGDTSRYPLADADTAVVPMAAAGTGVIGSSAPTAWVPPPWTAPIDDPYGPTGGGSERTPSSYQPPPPPERPRSHLGILTISAMVLVLGILATVDAAGADLSPVTYFFGSLSVIGLGLLVGTWFGRSRGLIALGIIATIIYVPVSVLDGVTDGSWASWHTAERVRKAPASVDEIKPSYQLDTGQIVLDLRQIDFSDADVSTTIDVGAGEIRVLVPEDVDIAVVGRVGLGQVDLLDDQVGGADRRLSITDVGSDGFGSGNLVLDLSVDIGHVEVVREAA